MVMGVLDGAFLGEVEVLHAVVAVRKKQDCRDGDKIK